jgi:AhpD family alkylhydroperoxidase
MPHISLPEGLPGISSGFAFRPETAKPMRELAHVLLHGPSTLPPAEREMIATYVSSQNDCYFCQTSHGAAATAHLGDDASLRLSLLLPVRYSREASTSLQRACSAHESLAQPTSKFTTPC